MENKNVVNFEIVKKKVETALQSLLSIDRKLLVNDASEQSIAHHLANHLNKLFPDWNIDCEYNRIRKRVKRVRELIQYHRDRGRQLSPEEEKSGIAVLPDIIIHRRDTDQNLLAIEIKKTSNPDGREYDDLKLQALRNEIGYLFSCFISLQTKTQDPRVIEFDLLQREF